MAEHHEPVPKHPIAPKVRQGGVIPHIGPSIEDYKKVHAQTIGAQSDEWWGTVSRTLHLASFSSVFRFFFFLSRLHSDGHGQVSAAPFDSDADTDDASISSLTHSNTLSIVSLDSFPPLTRLAAICGGVRTQSPALYHVHVRSFIMKPHDLLLTFSSWR